MEYDSLPIGYDNTLKEEYEKAVEEGFAGTLEEYIQFRDYT